ncbi:MAG: hypothetical protein U1F51_17030 [Burkholderiales bacterium]
MVRELRRHPRAGRTGRVVAAAAALAFLAAGCGIKGPLKLPDAGSPAGASAGSPPPPPPTPSGDAPPAKSR